MDRFGAESTADEVLEGISLANRRVLITGVSSGLGVETARTLAARGAHVTGAVRDLGKAHVATAAVRAAAAANGGCFDLIPLDLTSLANVRACAERLNADGRPFDLVIANAGIMACPQDRTADGFELQLGTNHLGHFVLINRLAPLMRQGSRVVILSSAAHRFADIELDDPNFERTPYDPWEAYGRSKTANALFAVEFDRCHRNRGVRAAAVHPGAIETGLGRYMTPEVTEALVARLYAGQPSGGRVPFKYKTIQQGAATTVWAGVTADARLVGGRYCEDCRVAEVAGEATRQGGVRHYAVEPEHAKALWSRSEAWVGEIYGVPAAP